MPVNNTWVQIKDNIRFVITVTGFLLTVGASVLAFYHNYFLIPMMEQKMYERDQAAVRQALLWTSGKFWDSYDQIPSKLDHHNRRIDYFQNKKNYFREKVSIAEEKGITVEIAPLE